MLLRREDAVLVVIDVQERLLPYIHENERIVEQVIRLVRGFQILEAPILVTEQYSKGIGPTDPRIAEAVRRPQPLWSAARAIHAAADADPGEPEAPFTPLEKMTFSCAKDDPFNAALERTGRRQVLLCGIEAHVCVLQTAVHLKERDYDVYLAADAVSSRSPRNVEIAMRRMAQTDVRMTSVEMAVFEMLHACGTAQFKTWSRIIR